MAHPVSSELRARRNRVLHPHRHSRDAGVRADPIGGTSRAHAGRAGAAPQLARGDPHCASSHRPADAVLHLHDLRADVRDTSTRLQPRSAPELRDAAGTRVDVRHPAVRQMAEQRDVAHRSEEHTSELQSQSNLVCRLLLEKKKKQTKKPPRITDMLTDEASNGKTEYDGGVTTLHVSIAIYDLINQHGRCHSTVLRLVIARL